MPVNDRPQDYTWGKRRSIWKIVIPIIGLLVVAGVAGWLVFREPEESSTGPTNTNSGLTLVPRVLDGVLVSTGQERRWPVAVVIENLATVRPQSGLSKASVVYEALAEGGITRFLAVYAGNDDRKEIGPIRSARPYFVDWVKEYDALFAHEGGSPQALEAIREQDLKDLHAGRNSQYYWRDTARKTAFEHTLFSSSRLLTFALRDRGLLDRQSAFAPWTFKSDAPIASRPTETKTITVDYSSFNYKVEYRYDRETNAYKRFQGGVEQKDNDGTILAPKNVVVVYVKTRLLDALRLGMETVGSGNAIIFRDGQAVTGSWKKDRVEDRMRFIDGAGADIPLNAGSVWIEVVPSDRTVTHT